jgi:D-alanyl-D-alanine carboxypeptidase/D-alanyl-D-alanine-endopeptidase (penicillin-binding protein 4)
MVCIGTQGSEGNGLNSGPGGATQTAGVFSGRVLRVLGAGLLLLAFAFPTTANAQPGDIPPEVLQALKQAGIPLARIGLVVHEVGASSPLISHGAGRSLNPASVIKLLTTLAGLDMLGPAYSWKTRVFADAEIRDGVLAGNLYMKGGGDPKLDLPRFWLLLRQLRALGLREIRGDLVLDGGLFDFRPDDPNRFDGEGLAAYNAQPDALLLNFNLIEAKLIPHEGGVRVALDPASAAAVQNELQLVDAPCNGWRDRVTASLLQDSGTARTLVLAGTLPAQCGTLTLYVNWLSGRELAETWFRPLWSELGGGLNGTVTDGKTPDEAGLLIENASPPLAEIIRDINKFSNNVMARQIYLALGSERFGAPAYPDKSFRAIKLWLSEKNVPMPELLMDNGAGLSRLTRVSAASLVKLLLAASASPTFPEFESSLPIAGVDGTMQKRLASGPAAGRARIKTGTLKGVRAAAGYVLDQRGRKWAVVFLINHANAERGQAAQDALIEWIALEN